MKSAKTSICTTPTQLLTQFVDSKDHKLRWLSYDCQTGGYRLLLATPQNTIYTEGVSIQLQFGRISSLQFTDKITDQTVSP